jgi:hypothetical protein
MPEDYYEVEEITTNLPKVKTKKKKKFTEIENDIKEQYERSSRITVVTFSIYILIISLVLIMVIEYWLTALCVGLCITFFYNSYIGYSLYIDPKRSTTRVKDFLILFSIIVVSLFYNILYVESIVMRIDDYYDLNDNGRVSLFFVISLIPSFAFLLLGFYLKWKYPIKKVDFKLYKKMHPKDVMRKLKD